MEKLPSEIKRMIAFHLLSNDPDERGFIHIKQLRLTNLVYAKVAAEPLFSTVYVVHEPESFEHIREVSADPVHAKFVKSLYYEPQAMNGHRVYHQLELWRNKAAVYLPLADEPTRRRCNEFRQSEGKFQEELKHCGLLTAFGHRDHPSSYGKPHAASLDPDDARQREDHRAFFAEVMTRFTHLNEVVVKIDTGITEPIRVFPEEFRTTGELPRVDVWNENLHGMIQLRAILLGAHDAGTKLESLKCGKIDWKFFQMAEEDMMKVKVALRHLTSLHIQIYAEEDATRGHTSLNRYRVGQFLSAAKKLRSFNIDFDECECTNLKYWVNQHTWRWLSSVQLNYVDADEDTLIAFLQRHASTLRDVTLCAVRLVQGDWTSALQRTRDAVKLKESSIYNSLTSVNPCPEGEYWCVDCHLNPFPFTTPEQMAQDEKLVKAIRKYILHGGDFPLLDRNTYPPGAHH